MSSYHGLTPFEQAVLVGCAEFGIPETATRLQRSKSAVYRALQTARIKFQAEDFPDLVKRAAGAGYLEGLTLSWNGTLTMRVAAAVRRNLGG